MPGPGDRDDQDDDDLIGFVSPASLQGQSRRPPEPSPQPSLPPGDEPALRPAFPERPLSPERPSPIREQVRAAATEAPMRQRERVAETDSFTLTVYLLTLMTVPTLGVAGVIALLAVWKRTPPADPLTRSHFTYQRRTLIAGGIAAGVGIVLLAAPFALGVTLLFALALWLLARGAAGVWKLKAGRAIENPMGWWI